MLGGDLIPGLTNIRVATRFLPPIDVDMSDQESPSARAWQPMVTATVAGQQLTMFNAFGDPGSQWMLFAAILVGGIAVAGAAIVRALK